MSDDLVARKGSGAPITYNGSLFPTERMSMGISSPQPTAPSPVLTLSGGGMIRVTRGPDKFELMIAFFDRFTAESDGRRFDRRVELVTDLPVWAGQGRTAGRVLEVVIVALEHMAPAGNVPGSQFKFKAAVVESKSQLTTQSGRIEGKLDTESRTGEFWEYSQTS